MSYIGKIFQAAAKQTKLSKGKKPVIYCGCSNTLFGTQFEGGINKPLFHFLVALKKAGYDVRLISSEPKTYKTRVKDYLKELGLNDRFFQNDEGDTIAIRDDNSKLDAFAVIDNAEAHIHGILAKICLKPDNPDLFEALKPFVKSMKKLPNNLTPKVLFG